ncbi:carbonic anhydrase family protein [Fructobacillus papyrifericola]|uniref:carbonic anhydrase n=1 Tax=Fructobacillus papyrifericola TaxID=2713172 RepID=A0ABS5QUZ3_9LACO|nr:carbonic anhydrase family protein [Fructobacillus papyrifericola]MBS9336632.1 carbonic anhydrase family protein [Fructobacillus papyrifericola]
MNKLDYHYQDAWRFTTTATCQSPIDVVAARLSDGPAMVIDWSGLQTTAISKKEQVIGDQFFCRGKLLIDGQSFELIRFHLHDGFEHLFDGQGGTAELHFVFERPDGGTLVLAVFFDEDVSAADRFKDLCSGQQTEADLQDFLPKNASTIISYQGTLTTPPLKEDVQWLLVQERLTISPADVLALKQAYPENHRAVQADGGRAVSRHSLRLLSNP